MQTCIMVALGRYEILVMKARNSFERRQRRERLVRFKGTSMEVGPTAKNMYITESQREVQRAGPRERTCRLKLYRRELQNIYQRGELHICIHTFVCINLSLCIRVYIRWCIMYLYILYIYREREERVDEI